MKKILRRLSMGALATLCLFSLSACKSKEQQQQAIAHKKITQNANNNLSTGQYFSDSNLNGKKKQALDQVAKQMGKNYKQIGNVKYSESNDALTLNLTGSQMTSLVQEAKQNNGQAKKFWKELTTGLKKTSITISKQLQDGDLKFNVKSPQGKEIYSVNNGNVSTDVLK